MSMFRILSSTASCALILTSSFLMVFTMFMLCSTRSRTMLSTSRPTYPTSVNFEASTLVKGASAILANLRAISVLPTPVEPIMSILLGMISACISSVAFMRLQRLRRAMATFFFASVWPMIYLSNSATIWPGVRFSIFFVISVPVILGSNVITSP